MKIFEARPRWGFLSLAVGYMAVLFWLSEQPGSGNPPPFDGADKVVHFLLYFGLGKVLNMTGMSRFYSALLGSTYGAFDEVHQLFVPGRTCDLFDWIADGLGATAGACIQGPGKET